MVHVEIATIEGKKICVDETGVPCENNWHIKKCYHCGIFNGTGGKNNLLALYVPQTVQHDTKNVETITEVKNQEAKKVQTQEQTSESEEDELTIVIEETKTTIQHKHSKNNSWHNHDLNLKLGIAEPCAYCGIDSGGIYKFGNLNVCTNCYTTISNICNGMQL